MFRIAFEESLTASQDLILVDLSDTTNWPHSLTAAPDFLRMLGWEAWMYADAAEELSVQIGLLTRVSATNGDVYFFGADVLAVGAAGSDRTGYRPIRATGAYGLPMRITANLPVGWDAYNDLVTLNDTAYQTDVNLATIEDPATADTFPAAGDIILRLTERSGTAQFEIGLALDYEEVNV